jgi:ribose 5-phosphate isomerase B
MSIAANRFNGVRATLCHDHFTARMSREHNDSNILVLGGRVTGDEVAKDILEVWLNTEFQGGRHSTRIEMFDDLVSC